MKKHVYLCAVLALVAAAPTASADDVPPPTGGAKLGVTPGGILFSGNGQSLTGFGGDAWVGYELMHGQVGITPLLDLGYEYFTGTPSAQLLFALPSVKLSYHTGSWIPAAMVGVGYGRTSSTPVSGGPSFSDNYFALSIGAELAYQISPAFALGVAVHYKPFLEPALNSFVDFGVSATFAL